MKGDNDTAVAKYTEGIELCTGGSEDGAEQKTLLSILHANRAQALLNLGRNEEALDDTNVSLKLDGNYIKAFYRKATAQKNLQQLDSALETLRMALKKVASQGGGKKKGATGSGRDIKSLRSLRNEVQALVNAARANTPSVEESLLGARKGRGGGGGKGRRRGGGGVGKDVQDMYKKVEMYQRDWRTCIQTKAVRERESKMNDINLGLLAKVENPERATAYRAAGKMYMLETVANLTAGLKEENVSLNKEVKGLEKREKILRRRKDNAEKELSELIKQHRGA